MMDTIFHELTILTRVHRAAVSIVAKGCTGASVLSSL